MPLHIPQLPSNPAEILSALQSLTASAHLKFAIAGKSFDAISFDGNEAISHCFTAKLYVLVDWDIFTGIDASWLGQPGLVTLTDVSGNERTLAGLVFAYRERGTNSRNQMRLEVTLRPRLWELEQSRDNRVFQGLSVPELVVSVLAEHNIGSDSALWQLSQTYPARQYTVQLEESDLAFIERLLSRSGIAYFFTVTEGRDVLNFTDDNAHFTQLSLGVIPFIADAGLDKPLACFNKFIKGIRQVPRHAQVVDYNYLTPENLIHAGQIPSREDPAFVHFGTGTSHQDEAELRVRSINERYAIEGLRIEIAGSVAGLQPGAVFSFVHPRYPQYSGDYVVVSISHSLLQQAVTEHEGDLGNLAYRHHAHLIPQTIPFRPALKPAQQLPTAFTARVESNGEYALLDEQGRFKVRMLFDTRGEAGDNGEARHSEASHTEASLPVRSLSFHGGPPEANTVGAAFPFRDGVEVVWGCLDGNPDQPIILGTLPNPATQSPVTSRNFGDNIIRTGGKNELLLHDIKDEEYIELKQGDYDRPFNLMRLDANSAGHSIKFACTLGAMEVYAKQTMKVEAGDSITHTHGNDRTETVENSHSLTTKNKDIHYQAATDQTHSASQNITHKAEKNIEHKAAETTQWRVSRNSIITIKQGDQIIKIDNGSLRIEAAKGISIKGTGSGSIKIGQSGAGIEIDSGGNVKLFGKAVTINGNNGVKLKGMVNWERGAGGSLSATALVPLAVSAIPKLVDPGAPAIVDLFIEPEVVPVGKPTKLLFYTKNFNGGETATITLYKYPDGDESRKTLVDTLSATLPDGMGQIEVPWTAPSDTAMDDTAGNGERVIKGPDEYRFEVKIDSTVSDQPSNPLWLTRDIDIKIEHDDGTPMPDGTAVRLKQANGVSRHASVKNGQAHFERIVMGQFDMEVSNTAHNKDA